MRVVSAAVVKWRVVLSGAVLVVFAVLIATVAMGAISRAPDDESGDQAAGSPQVVARVGSAAPRLLLPTLHGGVFDLEAVEGQPVWINVWASWCPPCRVEFPDIDEIRLAAADDGLVFLAINFGESTAAIRSFLENTGYTFDVGLDVTGEFEAQYQVSSLPMHIFIASDGSVDSLRVGGMTRHEMEEKVAELTARPPSQESAARP
jgi:thiol-disulfide isomerase/thioredoxin